MALGIVFSNLAITWDPELQIEWLTLENKTRTQRKNYHEEKFTKLWLKLSWNGVAKAGSRTTLDPEYIEISMST